LKLLIVHYHLRPGGIRRIIESATPHLVTQHKPAIEEVILATGEAKDREWVSDFAKCLAPLSLRLLPCHAFNYISEQRGSAPKIRGQIRRAISNLLDSHESWLVWFHNPGVGRNLILVRELARACDGRRCSVVFHHHDWWFDNRWQRWPEMRRSQFRTLGQVASAIFPAGRNFKHATINRADATSLRSGLSARTHWLPNLTERGRPVSKQAAQSARRWLQEIFGIKEGPIWILPGRLLRRKNVAEAILLTRWLRPEAWLITTGGISSAQEQAYGERLKSLIEKFNWPVRLGILEGNQKGKPSVASLIALSESVLLTSVQEGFGLPYLEAIAADRPLIARRIPNVMPDLLDIGFVFPYTYQEIRIPPHLFDLRAERRRQDVLFRTWRSHLPRSCRQNVQKPDWLESDNLPFARLTLTAQIEVLKQPLEHSWQGCRGLNPFLIEWAECIQRGTLRSMAWPSRANGFLSGPAYGKRLAAVFAPKSGDQKQGRAAQATQRKFIREKLKKTHLFPLLWAEVT